MNYEITNQRLFNQTVIDIDTDGMSFSNYFNGIHGNFCAVGHISIELEGGGSIESTGEHGSRDYQEEYGFILTNNED
jgi:hypothetical protein